MNSLALAIIHATTLFFVFVALAVHALVKPHALGIWLALAVVLSSACVMWLVIENGKGENK